MPFTLVTGRANAGKTGVLHSMVREGLARGGEPRLVVPTRADEHRAITELGEDAPMGLRVMRFDDLVEEVWRAGGDGRAIVSAAQRAILMRRCASVTAAPGDGLAQLASRSVRRLAGEKGAVWREARGTGPLAETVAAYARDLDLRGLVEPGEAVDAAGLAGLTQPRLLAVNGFADLEPLQERLVTLLSQSGWHVVVALTWEDGFPATDGVTESIRRLARLGEHTHLQPKGAHTASADLRRIESELFRAGPPAPPMGDVVFSSAEGEEAEAESITAEVLGMLASGMAPSGIAVVFRRAEPHRAALAQAFAEAGIAADFDVRTRFASVPLGRALCGLVRFADAGARSDLLAYLRSAYSGTDPGAVAAVEAHWRASGEEDRAVLARDAGGLGERTRRDLREVAGAPDARTWERLAARMMASAYGRRGVPLEGAESDAQAYALLMRTLGDLSDVAGGGIPAGELAASLAAAWIAPGTVERPGHVQVMGAERAGGRRFDGVVVGGLVRDEFPSSGDDALGSREVTDLFTSVGAEPPAWGGLPLERALFYEVVTRARRRLVLSRQEADSGGTPVGASPFWEELRDLYREPVAEAADDEVPAADRRRTLLETGLGEGIGPRAVMRSAVAEVAARSRAVGAAVEEGSRGLADPGNLAALAEREVFSATEIETYLQCPYRWFVSRRIGAEAIDLTVDRRMAGVAVHAALAHLYGLLRERTGSPRVTVATVDAALALVDECIGPALHEGEVPPCARDELGAEVRRTLARHLRSEAGSLLGYEPMLLEWRFGHGEQGPVPLPGVTLAGKVDRIDEGPNGALLVIDYKTGTAVAPTEWEKRGLVQLPLYAAAVREALGRPIAGFFYRGLVRSSAGKYVGHHVSGRVEGGVAPGQALDEEAFEAVISAALERAAAAVERMRAGEIPAAPTGDSAKTCAHCPAAGYCAGGSL